MGGGDIRAAATPSGLTLPARLRRVLSYAFLCSLILAPLVVGSAVVLSRDELSSCQHNAPADLTDEQFALTSSSDHWHGTLQCRWSGRPGTPTRQVTLPLYRWPVAGDD